MHLGRPLLVGALGVVTALVLGWVLVLGLARLTGPGETGFATTTPAVGETAAEHDAQRIRVKLFYVSEDGTRLVSVDREVPFAEKTADQARRLVEAALAPAPEPYLSPIPSGTTLRQIYLTERHEAFVDLSGELIARHPGGSLNELFTVYALVNVLTANLPAVTAVQILVDGKQVDTIAGHVDVRRPLHLAATE